MASNAIWLFDDDCEDANRESLSILETPVYLFLICCTIAVFQGGGELVII